MLTACPCLPAHQPPCARLAHNCTRARTAGLQVEQEEKERRKKEKAEAHLYTLVRISTDADLRGQIGSSRFFDLVDHDKVGGWVGRWVGACVGGRVGGWMVDGGWWMVDGR